MSDNPIIYNAKWIDGQHVSCPKCHALLSVDIATRFSEVSRAYHESHQREIDRLLKIIEEYEDEKKIGRYTLMNDDDVICHSDESKVIYEYAVECIKNGGSPKEMKVLDRHREGHCSEYTIVQFLWIWGY